MEDIENIFNFIRYLTAALVIVLYFFIVKDYINSMIKKNARVYQSVV